MTGSHEVVGSIPISSTTKIKHLGRPPGRPKCFCQLFRLRKVFPESQDLALTKHLK